MARIKYVDEEDLTLENRELFAPGLNLYRAPAHSPRGARSFGSFSEFLLHNSTLDSSLWERDTSSRRMCEIREDISDCEREN